MAGAGRCVGECCGAVGWVACICAISVCVSGLGGGCELWFKARFCVWGWRGGRRLFIDFEGAVNYVVPVVCLLCWFRCLSLWGLW